MHVDGGIAQLVALVSLALLVNLTATLWGVGMALRFQSLQAGPAMQIPVFLILFMAPVYVPLDLISGWVHDAASYNPLTALLESGRGFISGAPDMVGLAYLAGVGLVVARPVLGADRTAPRRARGVMSPRMLGPSCSGPARQLDPAALGDHVDRLYRAAWALCGSREDAEDLVQETFAKVLSKPRFLRNDDDLGYLLRVLRNTFVSRHRAAMRRPQSTPMPEELEPVDPSSATRPDSAVESREVFAYIASLPESFRDALVAVDVVGLSYGEAAKLLGTKEATITSRFVPGTRSGRSRDGSDPTRRPLRQAVVPPDQDIPLDPLDEELAERGRALIAAAVAETMAPLALRERIEADRARVGQRGGARRSRGLLGKLVPAAGLVAVAVVALVLVLGGSSAPSVLATASLASRRPGAARAGRGRVQRRRPQGVDGWRALPLLGRLVPVGGRRRARRQDRGPQRQAPSTTTTPRARAPPTRSSAATRSRHPRARASRPRTGPRCGSPRTTAGAS